MKSELILPEVGEVPVKWCNADAVTSSVMEAVSFVTPVLERFFILTVSEAMRTNQDADLVMRCREFLHEEATHTRVHKKFNAQLLVRLGKAPAGLQLITRWLDFAARHLSLSHRLALAAALEHFTAVISKLYLNHEARITFQSNYAKALFDMHAREELAHRSVVFDLWLVRGVSNRLMRFAAIMLILSAGSVYASLSVPWILYKKNNGNVFRVLSSLCSFTVKNFKDALTHTPLLELFSFARRDFHPEILVDDRSTASR